MFEKEIFIGFPLDQLYVNELTRINQNILATFVQDNRDYLQECLHENMRYFGKKAGNNLTISQLELLENNIYSLLKKIVPEFPYEETSLYFFPV